MLMPLQGRWDVHIIVAGTFLIADMGRCLVLTDIQSWRSWDWRRRTRRCICRWLRRGCARDTTVTRFIQVLIKVSIDIAFSHRLQ